MTQKTIELASIDQAQELVIDERTIATYDAAQGPLTVARLVNYGTLRILGENLQEAQIVAQSIYNLGAIESELPALTMQAAEIKAGKGTGSFTAAGTLQLKSEGDLRVVGGTFASQTVQIAACGKAHVHAYRIDALIKVKANELAIGTEDGDLNVAEHIIDGDPIFYAGSQAPDGGNLTIPITNNPGEDVSCYAVGNITVNGPIDTRGGDNQHPGRIRMQAGCQLVRYNGLENEGRVECIDCSLPFPGLEVTPPDPATNTKTITTGNLFAKGLSIEGGIVAVGNIEVDNDNIEPNIAGGASLFGTVSVTIADAKVVNRTQGNVFKGELSVGAGENITVGNVDGGVFLTTTKSGVITVGNVDGDIGSIRIFAGGDFSSGGGGAAVAAGQQLQPVPDASIHAGNLRSRSIIRLMANGVIGAGTVTLDDGNFSGAGQTHDIRIHANINRTGAVPVFRAGGGTTNGTGAITNNGLVFRQADQAKMGAVAITNGPGNIDIVGSNVRCLPNQYGVPGIAVDAPGTESDTNSGQIRVLGTLSTNGNSTVPAGFIVLMGRQLRANGAVVTASDTMATPEEEIPEIIVAVDRIELPGGLNIACDGNKATSVKIVPSGSEQLDIIQWPSLFPIDPNPVQPTVRELTIAGAGSLNITAQSEDGSIVCSGDALRFANNGGTHIKSERKGSKIELQSAGAASNKQTLIFAGGAVEVSTDNPQGDAGDIIVTTNEIRNTATANVSMHANAITDGKGGTITLDLHNGTLSLGSGSSAMTLAATSNGNHKGGTITVRHAEHNGTVSLASTFTLDSVDVTATGANGEGGIIDIRADHLVNNATGANSGFKANGKGTEKGGEIHLRLTDTINIGGAPNLTMTAKSEGTGDGGEVHLTSTKGFITVEGANILVDGGANGTGGRINIKTLSVDTSLTVNGTLHANGGGPKRGGHIDIDSAAVLSINTAEFHAEGGSSGRGGSVSLRSGTELSVQGNQISVKPGQEGSSRGGDINIDSAAGLSVAGTLDATGWGSGDGGTIALKANSAQPLTISGASTLLLANSGAGAGNGGQISISNVGGNVSILNDAKVRATAVGAVGNGGSISVVAGLFVDGAINIAGELSQLEADAGLAAGTGGHIALQYRDAGGGGQLNITSASITADQFGLVVPGDGGTVTMQNLANAALNVSVVDGLVSAADGKLIFTQPGQAITIAATMEQIQISPLLGEITATGSDLTVSGTMSNFAVLTFGNVNNGTDPCIGVTLSTGGGSIDQATGTEIKAVVLTLNGRFRLVGALNPINANVTELVAGPDCVIDELDVESTSQALRVSNDWQVLNFFYLKSTGDNVDVGNINQSGPIDTDGPTPGISISANKGLTVRAGQTLRAENGSITLQVTTPPITGVTALNLALGAQVHADGAGDDTGALGNVDVRVLGYSETHPVQDQQIPNVHVTPAGASFECGPNGLTAAAPENRVFAKSCVLKN